MAIYTRSIAYEDLTLLVVEAGAPHVQEGEGTGVPKEKEKDQGSVGKATST